MRFILLMIPITVVTFSACVEVDQVRATSGKYMARSVHTYCNDVRPRLTDEEIQELREAIAPHDVTCN